MRWALPLAILFLTAALAGCASDSEPQGTNLIIEDDGETITPPDNGAASGGDNGAASDAAAGSGNGNVSEPATEEALEPLVPELTADLTEGEAPFDVTFNFTVDDPDREGISWTLDVTGDGEADSEGRALPGNFTYSYTNAGEFNATFTVFDGEDEVSTTVVVVALEPEDEKVVLTTSFEVGSPPQGCVLILFTLNALDGVAHAELVMEPSFYGLPFTAEFDAAVPHAGVTVGFVGGGTVDTHGSTAPGGGDVISGTIPEGTERMVLAACGGGLIDVTVTIG